MSMLITPGRAFLYMKVGTHARESLEDIIKRKTKEIEDAGYALWGYGGSTCHPTNTVQPFGKAFTEKGGRLYLLMEEIQSNHFAEQVRASEASADGITWDPIPSAINALGSRYALVINDLKSAHITLPLARTRVASGRSTGKRGDEYIRGRVDKACLEVVDSSDEAIASEAEISLTARIIPPFAVYLRS